MHRFLIKGAPLWHSFLVKIMINKVRKLVNQYLSSDPKGYELQTLEVDKDNNILVEIDRLGVVDVDDCAALNRFLVDNLGPELDNYSLEVGSVSLTAPFKSLIQFNKNLGSNVIVTDKEGKRHSGQLNSVDEETFMVNDDVYRYAEVQSVIAQLKF